MARKQTRSEKEWKQSKLRVKRSPLNALFVVKNMFDRWDSRFRYEEFFLSWEMWWVVIWTIVYAAVAYVWIGSIWDSVPNQVPVLYGYHSLETLVAHKNWLWVIVYLPVAFAGAVLIGLRRAYKLQKEIAVVWVILLVLISLLSYITVFKIATIFG